MFQKNIVEKYLAKLNAETLAQKYALYRSIFADPEKQANIRASKEEQYQEGFVRDLFCAVLGYTIKPEPGYNILTELKNDVKNKSGVAGSAKKSDAAIVMHESVKAVIELKGCDTQDLDKVAFQAFSYKNFHIGCNYVIVSNFERLRLYVDVQSDFVEFNIFNLKKDDFNLLYLLLALDHIAADIPLKLKGETLSEEKAITESFYADYSTFKRELFSDLTGRNPGGDKLLLFKKTQKLLDRILFILFCEDRGLLPPNSVLGIIGDYEKLKAMGYYQPLYHCFKVFFNRIDQGFVNESDRTRDVFAYNGGLFKPDETLDGIQVGDDVLFIYGKRLAQYDFESQISVDILGRIFENSLTEIEEVQKELEGGSPPPAAGNISKRKKDGVFYTPAYITKYIVDNTIGTLCQKKRAELGIDDGTFAAKKRRAAELSALDSALESYRAWLLDLKILDPACGSGAFLIAALHRLKAEHELVDKYYSRLHQGELNFTQVENSILENNLYGVDVNEDSIEIAKLSLWLNTAKKNRKLTTLNGKIQCGNSLIDDPAVAGGKAFVWEREFAEVFENGGFDVVIGNPPYVNAIELKKAYSEEAYNYLKKNYETAKGTVDLYIYFFERGLKLLKDGGLLAFITPNRYLSASYGAEFRKFVLNNMSFYQLVDYSDKKVFADASTYPVITFIKKSKNNEYVLCGKFDDSGNLISKNYPSDKLDILEDSILGFLLNDKLPLTQKIISQCVPLSSVGEINATSTAKEADEYSAYITEIPTNGYKLINTGTIDPYTNKWGFSTLTKQGKQFLTPYFPKDEAGISENRHTLYSSPKIIISKIGLKCEAFLDKNGEYASIDTNCIHSFSEKFLPEYVLCWLNSDLYNYMFECFFDGLRMSGGYLLFSAPNLKNTYIKEIPLEQQEPFVALAEKMLSLNADLQKRCGRFISRIQETYAPQKISAALEQFHTLTFPQFAAELAKQKVRLTLRQKDELEDYFTEHASAARSLASQIAATDREINRRVRALYGVGE